MLFHLTPQQRFRLRRWLRTTTDLGAYRRTLALLQLDQGNTVTDVAVMLGVSRRTVHRWVGLYWDRPVPRSLITHHSTGRPSEWDEDARAILSATLHQPPDHFGYQATGWTVPLLQTHLAHWGWTDRSDATLRRELHALGYVWKRPRYVLDPDPRRAAKMRRIRQYIKALGPRDVVLFEDNRSPAVPAVAGLLGATRGIRRSPAVRCQRVPSALRGVEHAERNTAVPGAEEAACRGFPGVSRADP